MNIHIPIPRNSNNESNVVRLVRYAGGLLISAFDYIYIPPRNVNDVLNDVLYDVDVEKDESNKLNDETLIIQIENILTQIIEDRLCIDSALIKLINIFQQITSINANNQEINDDECKMFAQFIVYFMIVIILGPNCKSNELFILKLNRNKSNKLLQLLTDMFIPQLSGLHIRFVFCNQKSNEITNSLLSFVENSQDISSLITSFIHCPIYDFLKVCINFMYFTQKHHILSTVSRFGLNKYIKHICTDPNFQKEIAFNTIPFILSQLIQNDIETDLILLFTTQILLSLVLQINTSAMYISLSNFILHIHPIPFDENPKYWMDLIKMHFNDDSVQIAHFFRNFCNCRLDCGGDSGFNLFYNQRKPVPLNNETCIYDIAKQNEKYEYLYNEVIFPYFIYCLKDESMDCFHWFMLQCMNFIRYLCIRPVHYYDSVGYLHFSSTFLSWIDKANIIKLIKRTLYRQIRVSIMLAQNFEKIEKVYKTKPYCSDNLKELYEFIVNNGFGKNRIYCWRVTELEPWAGCTTR